MTTPVTVLTGALLLLNDNGWGQGLWYNSNTNCYCSDGALLNAAGAGISEHWVAAADANPYWEASKTEAYRDATKFLADVIERRGHVRVPGILGTAPAMVTTWNDMPGRTYAEVVEVFTQAIADAEAAA